MAKTYRVRITATQRVHYDQTVTMSVAELKEFKAAIRKAGAGDDKELGELAEGWLNLSDINDADDIEGDDVFVEFNPKQTA